MCLSSNPDRVEVTAMAGQLLQSRQQRETKIMSTEQYKEIIHNWVEEGWNNGNFRMLDEGVYANNYMLHDPSAPGFPGGIAAFKGFVNTLRGGMPDIHFTIEDMVGEGDKVLWRFTSTGTQNG